MSDNRDLCDNIEESNYNSLTTYINYKYSIKHGYDFKYLQPKLDDKIELYNCYSPSNKIRHSAWSKILSVIKVMEEYSQYEWICYLDSDCIFNDNNKTIYEYLKNSKNIYKSTLNLNKELFFMNNLPWEPLLPCAGFFIIKNTSEMLDFMIKWYSNETNHYLNTNHPWEQISLQHNKTYDYEIVNDWMFRERPQQFLRHIGSEEYQNRIPFFKNIIEQIDINNDYFEVINHLSNEKITYNTNK